MERGVVWKKAEWLGPARFDADNHANQNLTNDARQKTEVGLGTINFKL